MGRVKSELWDEKLTDDPGRDRAESEIEERKNPFERGSIFALEWELRRLIEASKRGKLPPFRGGTPPF